MRENVTGKKKIENLQNVWISNYFLHVVDHFFFFNSIVGGGGISTLDVSFGEYQEVLTS